MFVTGKPLKRVCRSVSYHMDKIIFAIIGRYYTYRMTCHAVEDIQDMYVQPIMFASLTNSNSTRQHIYVLCLLHKLQYSLMGVMLVEIDTLRLCLF